MSKPSLAERVNRLKEDQAKTYYALSLRNDFAALIERGLAERGLTQRELASLAGLKESYISRLINVATNFKVGVAARVLVPLGIEPMLVDRVEWDELRRARAAAQASTGYVNGTKGTSVQRSRTASSAANVRVGPIGDSSQGELRFGRSEYSQAARSRGE